MPQTVVQAQPQEETLGGWSDGEECRAPNGRMAVLVDGRWVGFVFEDGGGTCGRDSKTMVFFEVKKTPEGLKIHACGSCDTKTKRTLSKQRYHERKINTFGAFTVDGDRCQLFTL